MNSLPSFPKTPRPLRFATLLLTVLVCIGAPLRTATASDALTTSTTDSSTTTTGKSILSRIFGSKSSSSSTTSSSLSDRVNKGLLALPFGLLKTAGSAAQKAASKMVTSHITKN
ncbi:MAG: hypothetical protein ABI318_24215 [Chthoniobacteraceae bacterium]